MFDVQDVHHDRLDHKERYRLGGVRQCPLRNRSNCADAREPVNCPGQSVLFGWVFPCRPKGWEGSKEHDEVTNDNPKVGVTRHLPDDDADNCADETALIEFRPARRSELEC